MAKRKKAKRKVFSFGVTKRRRKFTVPPVNFIAFLKVLAVFCVAAGIVTALFFMKKNIDQKWKKQGFFKLVDPPQWANDRLKQKIFTAAYNDSQYLIIDEDAARTAQQNIEALVSWLDEIKVLTANDRLLIYAKWRKPLALIKDRFDKFYVDTDLVLLDYLPMPQLPIVKVEGVRFQAGRLSPGQTLQLEDLTAAVRILERLDYMDQEIVPENPLLARIDRIDVANFAGRKKRSAPHIVLYTKDNTQIIWGAEYGKWQRYMEAPDEEKLAKLYNHYTEHGTILSDSKYINLRDPQDKVFGPVDK